MTRSSCYACEAPAVGVRDRRPEGGKVELACTRHAELTPAELAERNRAREVAAWRAVWGVLP